MPLNTDPDLFASYKAGIGQVREAIAGMSADQLLATPVAGRWSTQQVVIHLADAEAAFTHRLKRIIAEDDPTFSAWDENRFVERLAYDVQSVDDAVAAIEIDRRQMTRVLDSVGLAVLDRTGTHTQRGPQTARVVMEYAVWHLSHHLTFVKEKKAALGL